MCKLNETGTFAGCFSNNLGKSKVLFTAYRRVVITSGGGLVYDILHRERSGSHVVQAVWR